MRLARKNVQKIFYSNFVEDAIEYERDEDGNIITVNVDGVDVPIEKGVTSSHYSEPVDKCVCFTASLNSFDIKAWGVDESGRYAKVVCLKGELDWRVGTVIWKDREILHKDDGSVDTDSSSHTVKGLNTDGIDYDHYLLERNVGDVDA